MDRQNACLALKQIGFGEYESKVYCALLEKSPANGYDVARRSGVPRSKVYESLEKLVERNAALRVETPRKESQVYIPTDPEILVGHYKAGWNKTLNSAETLLLKLKNNSKQMEIFWRILSVDDLIHRALALAEETKTCLHAALWESEFERVHDHLLSAVKKNVKLALVLYGQSKDYRPKIAHLQSLGAGAIRHCNSKLQNIHFLGRQFVLVTDRSQCITGSVLENGTVDGAYTSNKGVVINAIDLVNHEIYLERILEEAGEGVKKKFGAELEFLDAFDPPGFQYPENKGRLE